MSPGFADRRGSIRREQLGVPQLIGGVLILAGIALVRSEKTADVSAPIEPASLERAA